jgi:branched-chain amino acid aminotransferase
MHRFLLHNEDICDAAERILSPGQVGLLNGWGVFSTIRVYDGVMFAWERHWARMQRDAARMRVPFPAAPELLEAQLHRLIDRNHAANATLRVVVVRNRGGMWEGPSSREFDTIAFTAEVNEWGQGVRLGLLPQARHAASEFAGTKYLSWSENLTRYERAREQGLDEVILLNERGEVAECTSANLFAVTGSQVWTPPLTAGCLPGVTRAVLLEEIRAEDLEIAEKTLFPGDLESADEVFVTSTTRELLPVISVDGLKVRTSQKHPSDTATSCLQAAFTRYVKGYVAARIASKSAVTR